MALAGWGAAGAAEIEVRPGGVVRWSAPGTELCRQGERVWEPLGDTCYFGVDLEASGSVELGRRRGGQEETTSVRVGPYPYPEQRLEVEDRMVHLSAADQARVAREKEELEAVWRRESPARFRLPLSGPLPGVESRGNFGARRVFNNEPRSPHTGVDYRVGAGTPVEAVAPGRVALVADHFFAGRSVYVDHGNGLVSMYFHLSRATVEVNQLVAAGEPVGRVGSTGRATGPHLHFGLRWHGARVDPALLMGPPAAIPALEP